MSDARCDVIEEASDCSAHWKIRTGAHRFDIGVERCDLIADEVKFDVGRVGASSGKNSGAKPRKIDFGGAAIGVVQNCNAVDFKLVHRFNERTKHVRRDSSASVAHDMDIAGLVSEDGKRIDSAIHAGHDR